MRIFTALIALIITTSAWGQIFVDPCMDLEDVDFGFCDMAMGIGIVGGECVYISGCGWQVNGIDYTPAFHTSFKSCEACLQQSDCVNLEGMDFGECLAVLGIANIGGECTFLIGCTTYYAGVDYSFAIYNSMEECNSACIENSEGCTYSVALNFSPNATIDDGSCLFPECISACEGDLNGDDSVTVEDILQLLSTFGIICN